jgi:hypothetical protein
MSQVDFPSRAEGLALHLRLAAGKRYASADVCLAYQGPLVAWLKLKLPWAEADLVESAAHDALFQYVRHHGAYCPQQSDLGAYLRMLARCDLLNHLRREKIPLAFVELGEEAGNLCGREEEPGLLLERQEEVAGLWQLVASIRATCEPRERAVLDLLLEGERRTHAYSVVLGVEDQPLADQELAVKRVKDRIKKRLERGGGDHE